MASNPFLPIQNIDFIIGRDIGRTGEKLLIIPSSGSGHGMTRQVKRALNASGLCPDDPGRNDGH